MGKVTELIGIALRGVVVFTAIFGLIHMFYQAIGLYTGSSDYRFFSLSAWYIAGISLLFAAVSTVAPVNRITKAVSPVGTAGILLLVAAIKGYNIITLVENSARYLYNSFIIGVVKDGYTGMAEFLTAENYSYSEETLVKWSVILVAALFAFLFYFSVTKKARVILYALTLAPVIGLVFFFNIAKGNFGFALIVASIAGFLSMRIVDSRYGGRAERKIRRKAARAERAESAKEEREKRKIEKLKLKRTAEFVYDAAIDAEMGSRRAGLAKRSVFRNAKEEKKRNRKAAIEAEKAERKEAKEKKKADRVRLKEEKAARRAEIKRERSLPAAERQNARSAREDAERKSKALAKEDGAKRRKEKAERRVERQRSSRRNRAAGGYAASAAALVALAAILLPFGVSKNPFPKIKFIDEGMKKIRSYTTELLVGDGVDLEKNPYGRYEQFNYETIDFSPRVFEGNQIFRVSAPTKKTVYLKSRTALDYDIENDKWSFASEDMILDMNREFGKKFTSDTITKNAYTYLFPLSANAPTRFTTLNFEAYGFSVEQVHVERINGSSGILFVPYLMNPDLELLEYDSFERARDRYTPFFDGIYTSRYYGVDEGGYSTVSYVYNMTRRDLSGVFEAEKYVLELVYSLALREEAGESADALYGEYLEKTSGVTLNTDLAKRYFFEMDGPEKEDFREAMELELKYREYAENTYTAASGSEEIASVASEIFRTAEEKKGSGLTKYEKVMAVVEYLGGEEFEYTLDPGVETAAAEEGTEETEKVSAIVRFLTEVKRGYCSHFASSAVLLLREAGIPVRYTEGYHVSDYVTSSGRGSVDRYSSAVMDRNSHTWIEVYFDSVGWVPFEVTKGYTEYVDEVYDPETDPGTETDDPSETEDPAETDGPDTTDETEKPDDEKHSATVVVTLEMIWNEYKGYFIAAFCVIGAGILVFIIIKLIRLSAEAFIAKRQRTLARVRDDANYRKSDSDNRSDAKYLIDSLFKIFETVNIGPNRGEQLSEFAERLGTDYRGLSTEDPHEVMRCVLKEEFGHGLTLGEMSTLASYLEDVVRTVYAGLTWRERVRYRYIRHII